jgi:hypothetical protein
MFNTGIIIGCHQLAKNIVRQKIGAKVDSNDAKTVHPAVKVHTFHTKKNQSTRS